MSVSGLPMQLSVPCDVRFRPLLLNLTRRVAESVGLSEDEADALGQELADRTSAAAKGAGLVDGTALEIVYEIAGPRLRVRAACHGSSIELTRPLPGV